MAPVRDTDQENDAFTNEQAILVPRLRLPRVTRVEFDQLKSDVNELKAEVRLEFDQLKSDVDQLKAEVRLEFDQLKSDVDQLKAGVARILQILEGNVVDARRQFGGESQN
ncbi:hypothetical protein MP228_000150 [Amoeboaphelidium protococcarum]|nr:hypothetical protein MP228_000150 [Amoeboaphelidium protococcarum]